MWFTESPLDVEESGPLLAFLKIKAGLVGDGSGVSLPSMNTTSNMVGRSVATSCTHRSPICMHFNTSWDGYDSPKDESTISKTFPSTHMSQIWKNWEQISKESIIWYY